MTHTAQRLLADIRKLAPHITSRAAEIEAGHRTPDQLLSDGETKLGHRTGEMTLGPPQVWGCEGQNGIFASFV
jgi:hypothetical protein